MDSEASLSRGWPDRSVQPITTMMCSTIGMCIVGGLVAWGFAESPVVAAVAITVLIGLSTISPSGALGAAILAAPTAFTLNPFPSGSFSLLEISILVLSAGLGLRLVLNGRRSILRAAQSLTEPLSISLPAFAIFPGAVVAYLMLPDDALPDVALREMRVTIVEPLLLFAAALIVMRDPLARSWAWICAAGIGALIGIGAGIQVSGGFGGVDTSPITRATGIYSHPNNLALFLERTLLLCLPAVVFRPRTPLLWIAIGCQLVGLVLTYSRGALLAVFVGVGVSLLILGMRKALAVAAGTALVIGSVLLITVRERLLDLGGSGSEPTRFAIWRSSVRMLIDHPLFGVGPDQFLYQYGLRYIEPSAWAERYTSHPHNIVLDVWLRLGVVGVGAFVSLAIAIWRFVTRFKSQIRKDAISCGAIAALAGGLAHGLLDNGFFLPDLASLTWIAIAMIVTTGPYPTSAVPDEAG